MWRRLVNSESQSCISQLVGLMFMKMSLSKTNKGTVVVSWTGGKDGCFACYKVISEGNFDVHIY